MQSSPTLIPHGLSLEHRISLSTTGLFECRSYRNFWYYTIVVLYKLKVCKITVHQEKYVSSRNFRTLKNYSFGNIILLY
jgi:hypothetical protein